MGLCFCSSPSLERGEINDVNSSSFFPPEKKQQRRPGRWARKEEKTTQMVEITMSQVDVASQLSYMGVSKNRGGYPPKWMVYNGKPY